MVELYTSLTVALMQTLLLDTYIPPPSDAVLFSTVTSFDWIVRVDISSRLIPPPIPSAWFPDIVVDDLATILVLKSAIAPPICAVLLKYTPLYLSNVTLVLQ